MQMPVFANPLLPQQTLLRLGAPVEYNLYSAPSQDSLEKQGVERKHVICMNYPGQGPDDVPAADQRAWGLSLCLQVRFMPVVGCLLALVL